MHSSAYTEVYLSQVIEFSFQATLPIRQFELSIGATTVVFCHIKAKKVYAVSLTSAIKLQNPSFVF